MNFHCRIPHLGSEIQFVNDLVDQSHLVGEMGHMLTTLEVGSSGSIQISYLVSEGV